MALRLEDEELIEAFQLGDERVFDMVVAEHRDSLHRHAMRRLGEPAAADDAVQETFLRAYRSFARLHLNSRISPWLHQIMANVCIDEANRRRRHLDKVERALDPSITRFIEPGPEERLGLNRPDTSAVEAALDQLPYPYQEALTMRFVDEMSYEQMATATGTSEQNARARVSRARTAVRSILRGVAVLPVVGAFIFRRSARSAAALDRLGGAETASTATKMATTIAPAAETITTVVNTANQTIPLLTKAAIGVGAVSMFAMTTAPERSIIPPPPVEAAAPAAEATPDPAASGSPSATGSQGLTAPQTGGDVAANPATLDTTPGGVAASPEAQIPTTVPAAQAPAPVEPAPVAPETTAPPTTQAPVVAQPGSLQSSSLSVAPSGPRFDVAGPATLSVAGTQWSGSLDGRLRIEPGAAPTDPRRFEGTFTLVVDGKRLEIRLQGMATPLDAVAPAPDPTPETTVPATEPATGSADDLAASSASATRFSFSGHFRISGADAVGLLGSGSFSGSFGPGSLQLSFN